jgi:hypothetical protein
MVTEIDYMEYANDAAAQAAYVTNAPSIISNADIENEDMASITDWSDQDNTNGVSSQVTFDSKSCMKLDAGAATSGTRAVRNKDFGSFGASTVFSMSLYFDAIGTLSDNHYMQIGAYNGTYVLMVRFCSNNLYVVNSSDTATAIGTNPIVQDVWQEWTFKVTWGASGTVDIYLNGALFSAGVDCASASAVANGTFQFRQNGYTTSNQITYVDWVKAGSTTTTSSSWYFLQSYSESTIKTQGSYSLKGISTKTDSLNKTLTKTL